MNRHGARTSARRGVPPAETLTGADAGRASAPSLSTEVCAPGEGSLESRPVAGNGMTRWLVLGLIVLLGSGRGLAQGRRMDLGNPAQRAAAVEQRRADFATRHAAARARAARLGLPLRTVHSGGRITELVDFDGDRPLVYTTHNRNAAISCGASVLRLAPYLVEGTGLTVGEWDAGAVRVTHQEFGTRVSVEDGATAEDHATHVCGTLAAAGVVANARGMAPALGVVSYEWVGDTAEMTARGAAYPGEPDKIYLSNHSYGIVRGWEATGLASPEWKWYGTGIVPSSVDPAFGRYDTNAREADDLAASLPYFLMVRSAGNDRSDNPSAGDPVSLNTAGINVVAYSAASHPPGDGLYRGGYDTLTSEAGAKNALTVGAVKDAVVGGQRSLAGATMPSYSSWGPTDDGRIKPDLVANGDSLYSTLATGNTAYGTYSGTSMAAPTATGTAALLVQWWDRIFPGHALRASSLKALLIHTADDLGTAGPDYRYGWGLINGRAAADLLQVAKDVPGARPVIEDYLTPAAPTRTYVLTWDGQSPIRATLCWTDPAGTASTSTDSRTARLVNDLDLLVTGPTRLTHRPWIMPWVGNWTSARLSTAASTGANHTDNVEQVLLSAPDRTGDYTITVSFTGSLSGDGQEFSLVLSGSTTAVTSPPPTIGTLSPEAPTAGATTLSMGGTGFLPGATVALRQSGQADLPVTNLEVKPDLIRGRVNAPALGSGLWDVVATNPDGQTATLAGAFLVPGALWEDGLETGVGDWRHAASVGTSTGWTLGTARSHSPDHAFFAPGPAAQNVDDLYGPVIDIPGNATHLQLSFWHQYNLHSTRDGGVLEFAIDGGNWFDVAAAGSGASFGSGGYTGTLTSSTNPLRGRSAWTGSTSTFVSTTVNLDDPARYAGHQLATRWRLASNSSTASSGWYVDDLRLVGVVPPSRPPEITTPAGASPGEVEGRSAALSVRARDEGDPSALSYTWSVAAGPEGRSITFAPNGTAAAQDTTATFTGAGDYQLTVTVRNGSGLAADSTVTVRVLPTLTTIRVLPVEAGVVVGEAVPFAAIALDQFGDPVGSPPLWSWTISGGGAITAEGVFQAAAAGGPYTVTASNGVATGSASIRVAKGAASVTLTDLTARYDGTAKPVAAASLPVGLGVDLTYDGSPIPPTQAGSYAVVATVRDANYEGSASGTLVISKATAQVTLGDLATTYDGHARTASATTTPAGLAVEVTYNGRREAPEGAGTYEVRATVADPNYEGTATATLVISRAPAEVSFANLEQVYDGTPRSVLVATSPPGLTVVVTYDGSALAPTEPGNYPVSAIVEDADFQGSATATLVVNKALAGIALGNLRRPYDGNPQAVSAVTEPPGLTVLVTYGETAQPPSEIGLYAVTAVIDDARYQGNASGTLSILAESFVDWQARHFTPEEMALGQALELADPDADGWPNLAEYALGTLPHQPSIPLTLTAATGTFEVQFERPKGLPDVEYAAESSDDLVTWTAAATEVARDGPVQTLRVAMPPAGGGAPQGFVRLRFTRR